MSRTGRRPHWWRCPAGGSVATVGTDDALRTGHIVDVPAEVACRIIGLAFGLLVISTLLPNDQLSLSV